MRVWEDLGKVCDEGGMRCGRTLGRCVMREV